MTFNSPGGARIGLLLAALGPMTNVLAHEGHDHAAPAPAMVQALAARVEASSEEFALLGILQGDALVLYLDRYASNEPIADARIELERGSYKVRAAAQSDGSYRAPAGPLAGAGEHALVITVEAGAASDLLDATLRVAAPATPAVSAQASGGLKSPRGWIVGGGAALLAVLGLALARRRRAGAAE